MNFILTLRQKNIEIKKKKKHGITKQNLNKTDQKFQNSINTGQHDEFNLRPSRKCTQLSVSSLQKTISRLCISMLFCDDTLRSSFATCVSRGLKTVVARHRQNNPMAGILFSKEIIYRKNGSTVFSIFYGRPQIFVVQWSKKLSVLRLALKTICF